MSIDKVRREVDFMLTFCYVYGKIFCRYYPHRIVIEPIPIVIHLK